MFITCAGWSCTQPRLLVNHCRYAPRGKVQSSLTRIFFTVAMTLLFWSVIDGVAASHHDIAIILQFGAVLHLPGIGDQLDIGVLVQTKDDTRTFLLYQFPADSGAYFLFLFFASSLVRVRWSPVTTRLTVLFEVCVASAISTCEKVG